MSQLIDNLNIIESVKTDIKAAIENKGVDMTGVSFPGYASKIGEITTSFVTVPLNVSANGTYTPSEGVDGWNRVTVDVPQSVTGFTEKEVTEGIQIVNLSNSASYVHPFVFEKDNYLQTVNLPNCTSVGENAFAHCYNLTTVNLPVCTSIGDYVFYFCSNMTTVNIPKCEYLEMNVFNNCQKMVSFYGPSVSIIGQNCFNGCINLNSIYIPLCHQIENGAFKFCSVLTSIDLPEVSWLASSVFSGCSNLSYINIPKIGSVKAGLFKDCTSLTTVLLGSLSSSVIPLYNSNVFTGTPIALGSGSIYVPASLVESYKTATNWTYFSDKIVGI